VQLTKFYKENEHLNIMEWFLIILNLKKLQIHFQLHVL
jgi:hypothetical protein